MSHLFLVEAPQVPTSERDALAVHFREALLDSDYTLITNYDLRITVIEKHPTDMLIVNANGIPLEEVRDLRKRIDAALAAEKSEDKFLVVNYECLIYTVPGFPTVGVYGEITDPEPEETKLGHEEVEALIRSTFAEVMGEQDVEKIEESGQEGQKAFLIRGRKARPVN
jgi:hypothetical protein